MERLKCFTRGLVAVSAATCWLLVAAHPALASTLFVRTGPTLTADPTSAYPGVQIKVYGANFGLCEEPGSGATNVMVFWDGSDPTKWTGLGGGFSGDVAVPSDASAGFHQVTAACYDPQAGTVTSDTLASTEVQVLQQPALQLSSSEAAAGADVTVAGTGFGQCAGKGLGDPVQLLWDTSTLGGPVGLDGNGAFSMDVTIPAAATAGSQHTVAAECYDPAAGSATSGVLARSLFGVTSPTSPTSPASTSPTSPTSPASTSPTSPTSPASTSPTSPSSPASNHVLADGDRGPALDTLGWPVVVGRTDRGPWREPGGGGRAPGRAAGDARQSPAAKQLLGASAPADGGPAARRRLGEHEDSQSARRRTAVDRAQAAPRPAREPAG